MREDRVSELRGQCRLNIKGEEYCSHKFHENYFKVDKLVTYDQCKGLFLHPCIPPLSTEMNP